MVKLAKIAKMAKFAFGTKIMYKNNIILKKKSEASKRIRTCTDASERIVSVQVQSGLNTSEKLAKTLKN